MHELSAEFFRLIYGLTYFTLGLAILARALAYPPTGFRSRLLALSLFGLLHAAAAWLVLVDSIANAVPPHLQSVFTAPSFLALYYFAFGWREKWPMAAHAAALATICSLAITIVLVSDPAFAQLLIRIG